MARMIFFSTLIFFHNLRNFCQWLRLQAKRVQRVTPDVGSGRRLEFLPAALDIFAFTECYLHLVSEIWFSYSCSKCFVLLYCQSPSCWYQFHRCLCLYSPKQHTHSFMQQATLASQWLPTLIYSPKKESQFQGKVQDISKVPWALKLSRP